MIDPNWFDDLPVVGALPPAQQAAALRALGEADLAADLDEAAESTAETYRGAAPGIFGGLFQPRAWQHTAHAFGYFRPAPPARSRFRTRAAATPDDSLKGQRIKVTLDRLRVADYPGGGEHHILLTSMLRIRSRAAPRICTSTRLIASVRASRQPFAATRSFWG